MAVETRSFVFENAEIRSKDDGDTVELTGYCAVFGPEAATDIRDQLGTYREHIHPQAFNRALAKGDSVPLLVDHLGGVPLATFPKTMSLTPDQRGLKVRADLDPKSPAAASVISAVRRGDLTAWSFSFTVGDGGDVWSDNYQTREVRDIEAMWDASLVNHPAYKATTGTAMVGVSRAQRIIADERAGKVLSGANSALLAKARQALKEADGHLGKISANAKPRKPKQAGPNSMLKDEDAGAGNGSTNDAFGGGDWGGPGSPGSQNPLAPQDGLGPRAGGAPRDAAKRIPSSLVRALSQIQDARDAEMIARMRAGAPVAIPAGADISPNVREALEAEEQKRARPDTALKGGALVDYHRAVRAEVERRLGKGLVLR